jgi:hypothetical protein
VTQIGFAQTTQKIHEHQKKNTGSLAKGLNKTLSNKRITTTFVYKK